MVLLLFLLKLLAVAAHPSAQRVQRSTDSLGVFHFCDIYLADDKCRERWKTDRMESSQLSQLPVLVRLTAAAAWCSWKNGSHVKSPVEITPGSA